MHKQNSMSTEELLWSGQKKNYGGNLNQFYSCETSPLSLGAAPNINPCPAE